MKLFEPYKIGKLAIKNRIVMASMQVAGLVEPDGRLSQRAIDFYIARAKGGAGLIITSAVRPRKLEELPLSPLGAGFMADNTMYLSRLSELSDAIHDYRAKVAIQFTPGRGRATRGWILRTAGAVAPSPVPCFFNPSVTARELTIQEIEQIVKSFEYPAEVVSKSGIDAIEINCHGGYLADQFMTALWNKRTDRYGGSLEGRLRFVIEIIESIRKGAGTRLPIIVRYALTHYLAGGREVDEGVEIARRLEAAGVGALNIDAGCFETYDFFIPSQYQVPGSNLELAEKVKKAVKISVIAVGKLGYPGLAEKALQDGKADFIALGRSLLADPEWPNKVQGGRLEDIRPCIGDECCVARIYEGKYISCSVNPSTGMERELVVTPAEKKKSVLVVGGGPAGMEAAIIAALRGHRVTLWEKSEVLGGNLVPASVPSFKRDYKRFLEYLVIQIRKLDVAIELEKEATAELILHINPDVVLLATGSSPIIPGIPGVHDRKVVTAVGLLSGKGEAGESVVIVGGGLIGCETALYLADKRRQLTIVEALDNLMSEEYWINRVPVLRLLSDAGVKVVTNTTVSEIDEEGINIVDKSDGIDGIAADTIILAVGMKPDDSLLQLLIGRVPEIYSIGDCVEPRRVINAIWEGFRTARLI